MEWSGPKTFKGIGVADECGGDREKETTEDSQNLKVKTSAGTLKCEIEFGSK